MKRGFKRNLGSVIVGISLALGSAAGVGAHDSTQEPQGNYSAGTLEVLRQLESELQKFVDNQPRLSGQAATIGVKLNADQSTGVIWVDLDSGFLPRGQSEYDEGLGEKVREVTDELYNYLSGTVKFSSIRARIGGKTLGELFPPEHQVRPAQKSTSATATPVAGLVVLNPGHGRYLHHADTTWRLQRPEAYSGTTDVFEDDITPLYSASLATYLRSLLGSNVADVRHTRDIFNAGIEPESGVSWADLAARYYIKSLLPNEGSTVWGLYPNGTSASRRNLREYDEDLMARPKYANHINAEAMISIHTDALSTNPNARGASAVAKLDDPDSVQLAENILCYMKEQITARPAYADYVIRPTIKDGDAYAEVRETAMPTALIEIGFHTNEQDSAALRTSEFRLAAARGIEKGYRTYKKGEKDCRPLTITKADPVAAQHGFATPYTVEFIGTPSYPLYLRTAIVSCPPNYSCTQYAPQYTSPSSTPGVLAGEAKCTTAHRVPGSVIVVDRYLEDGDGVKSPKVRSSITCN
mgnify:CR=1 FL=1